MIAARKRLPETRMVTTEDVLNEGRVIEEGAYHELRSREQSRFREMVEMQRL